MVCGDDIGDIDDNEDDSEYKRSIISSSESFQISDNHIDNAIRLSR